MLNRKIFYDIQDCRIPTKQKLNQAIRAGILGGDYLLDLFNYLHIVRRYDLIDECRRCRNFLCADRLAPFFCNTLRRT